jgi:hypothetical protein
VTAPDPCDPPTPKRRNRPTGDPNPFEAFLLGVCAIQGWSVLAGTSTPTALQASLGPTLRFAWAFLLLAGGIAAVAGLYWPGNVITGVEIKRVGIVATGLATLAYGVALLLLGPVGLNVALLNFAFSTACFTRTVQVTRRIRGARRRIVAARDPEG